MTTIDLTERLARAWWRTSNRRDLRRAARSLDGVRALELGAPSSNFAAAGLVPLYPRLVSLDVLDFAEDTLWAHARGQHRMPRGERFIGEAGDLGRFADGSYGALLASHVLEHLANPLGALREWSRVVSPGGWIVLVVPHRDGTFDHRRPVTTLEHLRADAERNTAEDDLSHVEEVLSLHDLSRDPGAGDLDAFTARCRENAVFRGMHHHVFVSDSVGRLCAAAGLRVALLRALQPFDIVALCQVVGGDGAGEIEPDEQELRRATARSPFPSDRAA